MNIVESFWSRVNRAGPDECWPWMGAKGMGGYGHTYVGGERSAPRFATAHRRAYELAVGPIPAGLQIDHLCRNRACCNPAHLEPVTPAENMRRSPFSKTLRTHCPRGHAYDEANTYTTPRKQRICRECRRVGASLRYYAKTRSIERVLAAVDCHAKADEPDDDEAEFDREGQPEFNGAFR